MLNDVAKSIARCFVLFVIPSTTKPAFVYIQSLDLGWNHFSGEDHRHQQQKQLRKLDNPAETDFLNSFANLHQVRGMERLLKQKVCNLIWA